MVAALITALTVSGILLSLVLIQRSRRYGRHQAKLGAAFDRAQEVRIQRPQGLYGERAWTTLSSRSRGASQITLLNIR